MPTRRLARRSRGFARPRRRTQWVDSLFDLESLGIGMFFNQDLLGQYRPMDGAEATGVTVLRTHLYIWVTSTVVNGDGIFMGLTVDNIGDVTPAALPIGAAPSTVINPQDQPYVPWMLYRRFNAHPQYSFMGAVNNLEFDVKSKRRVAFGNTLILSLGNVDASAEVSFSVHSRVLLALS